MCTDRFTDVFHRLKNHIYDFALTMLGDSEAAGDVTQETFIRFLDRLRGGDGIDNEKNWLFIVARNRCLNLLRDARRTVRLEAGAINRTGRHEGAERLEVQQALNAVDVSYREALVLKVYHGFSYDEIAGILDITLPAVRSRIYKARLQLKDYIAGTQVER